MYCSNFTDIFKSFVVEYFLPTRPPRGAWVFRWTFSPSPSSFSPSPHHQLWGLGGTVLYSTVLYCTVLYSPPMERPGPAAFILLKSTCVESLTGLTRLNAACSLVFFSAACCSLAFFAAASKVVFTQSHLHMAAWLKKTFERDFLFQKKRLMWDVSPVQGWTTGNVHFTES